MTEHAPLLGRCKECDFALFATRDQIRDVADWRGVGVELPYRVAGISGIFARCPKRHKVFPLKTIKGTYSADHKCDSRCLNAKGHSCTCSCGGMNHGRGYAVVIHEAGSEEPATEKQLEFIAKLIEERALTVEQTENALKIMNGLTKSKASAWIERLLELPTITKAK